MRATVALIGLVVFLLVAFGLRGWLHRRATGSWGFRGISGPAGSAGWWGGVLFVVGLALLVAAPPLILAGVTAPLMRPPLAVDLAGAALVLAGAAGTLWAQAAMGASWRIGVRATETTALVTRGPFGRVRNPVFAAIILAAAGFLMILPAAIVAAALVCLVAAVVLQVRCVEEPYLRRVHGAAYEAYCARAGRFWPRLGT